MKFFLILFLKFFIIVEEVRNLDVNWYDREIDEFELPSSTENRSMYNFFSRK